MPAPYLPGRWVISPVDMQADPTVFPLLKGKTFIKEKTPVWSTKIDTSVSGVERRRSLWAYPIWRFQQGYEFLRDASQFLELQTLVTFFNSKSGSAGAFFYLDHYDNQVTSDQFGTGDGTTTTFQVTRTSTIGSLGLTFTEPVRGFNGQPFVTVGGVTQYPYARTNLLLQSQAFDNAAWTKANATVTAGAATAPDGTATGELIAENVTTVSQFSIAQNYTFAVNTYYFSAYLRKNQRTQAWMQAGPQSAGAYFDLNAGTVLATYDGATAGIVAAGSGWYRCWISFTATAGSGTCYIGPALAGSNSYAGVVGDGIDAWGAQLEVQGPSQSGWNASSYVTPTPYILTTSASVTITDYTIGSLGMITFATAPKAGAALQWSGSFYFLCRFAADDLSGLGKIASGFWDLSALTFQTFKS